MIFAEQLLDLKRLSLYSAPAECSPTPYTIPENTHVVELLLGGVVFFDNGSGVRPYRRGTLFWHISGDKTISETTREEPYSCLVFHFASTDAAERLAPRVSFWLGTDEALEDFSHQVFTAFHSQTQNLNSSILANYCASELLMHALKIKTFHAKSVAAEENSPEEKELRTLLLYIEKNLANDLSVDFLSDLHQIPRNRLFRLFRDFLQLSPHEYITGKRLENARKLLESTRLPIKETAARCGFDRVEVFHRVFVKHFGETPKHYRENHHPYQDFSQ